MQIPLTKRQATVLNQLIVGRSIVQIAATLDVSVSAVRQTLDQLKIKLSARNLHELIAQGVRREFQ